jgi:hypothetical protein
MKRRYGVLLVVLILLNGLIFYNLYLAHQCSIQGRTVCLTPLLFFASAIAPAAISIGDLFPTKYFENRELLNNMVAVLLLNVLVIAVYMIVFMGIARAIRNRDNRN